MKVTKRVESLLKEDTNSERMLEELERNEYVCKIEDWDQMIAALHEKKLRNDSEVVLLNYLSANILEGEFVSSLGSRLPGGQDSKIVLNLLNLMSFKIKSQPDEIKRVLSVSYGSLYCYLSRKIFPHLKDFNESHKKIKQRIEEDGKHLVKLMEYSLHEISGCDNHLSAVKIFLTQLVKLLRKQPHIFKNQAKQLEFILFTCLEKRNESNYAITLLRSELQEEVSALLSNIPLCVNTVAAYPDRVRHFISKYFNNLQYAFLLLAKGVQNDTILTAYAYEDAFAETPSFIFDWDAYKTTGSQTMNSLEMRVAITKRVQLLTQILRTTIANIKSDSVHSWNLLSYLKIIEAILSLDAKHLTKQAKGGAKGSHTFEISMLENKLALHTEDYCAVSMEFKKLALKILSSLVETNHSGMAKYSEWLYNALYFVTVNYEGHYSIIKQLFKTSSTIITFCGSIFFEFGEYLIFQSPIVPLNILLEYYGTVLRQFKQHAQTFFSAAATTSEINIAKHNHHHRKHQHKGEQIHFTINHHSVDIKSTLLLSKEGTENDLISHLSKKELLSLTRHILICVSLFLQKCGRLQNKPELIAQLDAVFSKIISYPRVIAFAPSDNKSVFFECLESLLLNNLLKFEETQLFGEFDLFFGQYLLAEEDHSFISLAQQIKNRVFSLRQSKRLSFIDNSLYLQSYIEKRYNHLQTNQFEQEQESFSNTNDNIPAEIKNHTTEKTNENTTISPLLQIPTQNTYLDENDSWEPTNSQAIQSPNKNPLKRTFVQFKDEHPSSFDVDELATKKKIVTQEKIACLPDKKTAVIHFGKVEEPKHPLFITKSTASTTNHTTDDQNDQELIINPILDSD